LQARLYRPVGTRAFAAVVDIHGGNWSGGDRLQQAVLDRALASNGVLVMAIDFRQAPTHPYPASGRDVSHAIRWLQLRAEQLGAQADVAVGALGSSSGGHIAILSGIRPRAARLAFVIADAPVTNVRRYIETYAGPHAYWTSPDSVRDGDPTLILQRDEAVCLPPLLITHGAADDVVPVSMSREFVELYRSRGGHAELVEFEGVGHGFVLQNPRSRQSIRQATVVLDFIRRHAASGADRAHRGHRHPEN
jgi:acetyl esterase/lipase